MAQKADVVIIGGGIIGVSIAYHLAQKRTDRIVVLEKGFLGQGSTGLCAGGIRTQYSTEVNIRLSLESLEFWIHFEEHTGVDPEFRQVGYLFLTSTPETWSLLQQSNQLQQAHGLPVELLDIQEIHHRWPFLRCDDLLGATFCVWDGYAGPHEALTGFTRMARQGGVTICEQTEVLSVHVRGDRVSGVTTTQGNFEAPIVISACGAWASVVGRMVSVDIPVKPFRRQLYATAPFRLTTQPVPLTIDLDQEWYFRPEGAGFLISGPADKESSFRRHIEYQGMAVMAENAIRRVPDLQEARVSRGWAGLYAVSPDHHAILGPVPGIEGFIVANGFSGHGFQHSPAIGRIIADLVTEGTTSHELSSLSIDRFRKGESISEPLAAFKD
jgi:sarcosine oxidase subunit beta